MRHVRVIVTETGASIEIERVIHGQSEQSVEQRTREQLRQIIECVTHDNPKASCDNLAEALRHGYWWTDLGSEEFTVKVLAPQRIEQVNPLIVKVDVESGLVCNVHMPPGIQLVVRDYDTDGTDEAQLHHDGDGQPYVKSTWEGEHTEIVSDSFEKLCAHLHGEAFVVLTRNAANEPDSRFEAWAYEGPLDFEKAGSVRFGLGADPTAALAALDDQLGQRVKK